MFGSMMKDTEEGTGRQWEGGSGNGERREALLGSMMKGTEWEGMRGRGGQIEGGEMKRDREGWRGKERRRGDDEEEEDIKER